jgi:hypothetical protein
MSQRAVFAGSKGNRYNLKPLSFTVFDFLRNNHFSRICDPEPLRKDTCKILEGVGTRSTIRESIHKMGRISNTAIFPIISGKIIINV